MTEKRFTITKGFDEHERQIRDNGKIIMGCFIQPQAEPIVKLLNELHEENTRLQSDLAMTIDSKSKEIRSLKEDVTILQKALWCSGCENDYDRLRQLRKGFLE